MPNQLYLGFIASSLIVVCTMAAHKACVYLGGCTEQLGSARGRWMDVGLIVTVTSIIFAVAGIGALVHCIRTIWFHPLSQYPGPTLAKLTNAYSAYHSWKGDLHIDIWRAHQVYGDYVRYGPNRVVFNTATALDAVYNSKANVIKSKGYTAMMARIPNTVTQRDKALHSQQRRLLAHAFSEAALKGYEKIVKKFTKDFCHYIISGSSEGWPSPNSYVQNGWGPAQDIGHWSENPVSGGEHLSLRCLADYLTFDIMLEVVYGLNCGMMASNEHRYLFEALHISNKRVGVLISLPQYKNTYLDWWLFRSAIEARYAFIAFIRRLMDQKSTTNETKEGQQQNVYDVLTRARDGEGLSMVEIASESTNLILAGYDTTSTALAASLFYLSRNPEAYKRAATEVREICRSITGVQDRNTIKRCVYLQACIEEALRLAPPVPSSMFREVESGGILVDGKPLPAGCDIGVGIYAIQHNSKYFHEPFKFAPERWITGDEDIDRRADRNASYPFSKGPRQCIGKNLALSELTHILATILLLVDFKAADGSVGNIGGGSKGDEFGRHRPDEFQLYDHVMASKKGPVLQFRVRDNSDRYWDWNRSDIE